MANVGITPVDPTTPIGQLRNAIGDGVAVPLSPAQAGFGDYQWFSDDELTMCLTLGGVSMLRAVAHAYIKMSVMLGIKERAIADLDLKLDLKGQSAALRQLAEAMFEQADASDRRDANDIFSADEFPGFSRGVRGEFDLWPHLYPAQGPQWPNSVPLDYPVETGIYGPI